MCDFLGYEIEDILRMKKFVEEEALEEEPELEKAEEQPITITSSPYNHYKPIISYIFKL